jgi:hypothetical protein
VVSVEAALAAELEAMPGDVQRSSLAMTALTLAAQLDSTRNGGTSKAMIAKEYRETLRELRAIAPPAQEDDEVDRARKRRAERLARRAATQDSART